MTVVYQVMLRFAEEAARCVPEVVMTVVGEPVTSLEKQERRVGWV
jgi:hypothetical protein